MKAQKRKYEIAFLQKEENPVIPEILKKRGFTVFLENPLMRIRLAYPIKKETYAHFGYCHFEAEAAAIKELRAELKLKSGILRYLIVTPPFVKKEVVRRMAPERPEKKAPAAAEPILTNEVLEEKIKELVV